MRQEFFFIVLSLSLKLFLSHMKSVKLRKWKSSQFLNPLHYFILVLSSDILIRLFTLVNRSVTVAWLCWSSTLSIYSHVSSPTVHLCFVLLFRSNVFSPLVVVFTCRRFSPQPTPACATEFWRVSNANRLLENSFLFNSVSEKSFTWTVDPRSSVLC